MNYYDFYRENKKQWESLTMKSDRTPEEIRTLRLLDVLNPIVGGIDSVERGAIPRRMARCCFDTFSADTGARVAAESFASTKKENLAAGKNLIIQGPVGVGKTHLAVAVAWELIVTAPRHALDFWSIVDFVQLAKDVFDGDRGAREYADAAPRVDWLVIDDLGQERPTEWTRELIYSLVSRRYNAQKPTIITTNLTAAEIAERYGDPVASRLFADGAEVISFDSKDHRLKQRGQP